MPPTCSDNDVRVTHAIARDVMMLYAVMKVNSQVHLGLKEQRDRHLPCQTWLINENNVLSILIIEHHV